MRDLLDVFKEMISKMLPRQPIYAEVVSYDSVTNTITVKPTTDSDNIEGVSLDAQGDETKGFFAIPKVGSDVLIGFIDNEPYLKMYSEVDSVLLKADTFGGLVKIENLLYQHNNNLVQIKTAIGTICGHMDLKFVALGQVGDVTSTFSTTWGSTVVDMERDDLENTNVKHG